MLFNNWFLWNTTMRVRWRNRLLSERKRTEELPSVQDCRRTARRRPHLRPAQHHVHAGHTFVDVGQLQLPVAPHDVCELLHHPSFGGFSGHVWPVELMRHNVFTVSDEHEHSIYRRVPSVRVERNRRPTSQAYGGRKTELLNGRPRPDVLPVPTVQPAHAAHLRTHQYPVRHWSVTPLII